MEVAVAKHRLFFKTPSRTSREVLIGECAVFPGLSCDWTPDYERVLHEVCCDIKNSETPDLSQLPSIKFGVESAMAQFQDVYSDWRQGRCTITINGLVWMGSEQEMMQRVSEKIEQGFRCIKLKIGGIDFNREIAILRSIRSNFSADIVELRLDANGSFLRHEALQKLDELAQFQIHSIEQPIKQGLWRDMNEICSKSPIPIALDEELIGLNICSDKERMLDTVVPQYIILKPTLCGGLSGSDEWIRLARQRNIGWWATSALESNVGLDSIANWVSAYHPNMPQGLGTGELYTNNIPSPLVLSGERLSYNLNGSWDFSKLNWVKI